MTWLDSRLFTDLNLWDYMQTADDSTAYALIHVKFLMHVGHELGVIHHPESQRALRRSLQQAQAHDLKGEMTGLLWLDGRNEGLDGPTQRQTQPPRREPVRVAVRGLGECPTTTTGLIRNGVRALVEF